MGVYLCAAEVGMAPPSCHTPLPPTHPTYVFAPRPPLLVHPPPNPLPPPRQHDRTSRPTAAAAASTPRRRARSASPSASCCSRRRSASARRGTWRGARRRATAAAGRGSSAASAPPATTLRRRGGGSRRTPALVLAAAAAAVLAAAAAAVAAASVPQPTASKWAPAEGLRLAPAQAARGRAAGASPAAPTKRTTHGRARSAAAWALLQRHRRRRDNPLCSSSSSSSSSGSGKQQHLRAAAAVAARQGLVDRVSNSGGPRCRGRCARARAHFRRCLTPTAQERHVSTDETNITTEAYTLIRSIWLLWEGKNNVGRQSSKEVAFFSSYAKTHFVGCATASKGK